MGVSAPELENVGAELSPWNGAVRWSLSLSSQEHPLFSGALFSPKVSLWVRVGRLVHACSLEVYSGYILALRRECHQGLQSWRERWAPRIPPHVATLVAYC